MIFGNIDRDLTFAGKQLEKNPGDWETWAAKADILCSLCMCEAALDAVIGHWNRIKTTHILG